MKKIVIYSDEGSSPFCVSSLLFCLEPHKKLSLSLKKREFFEKKGWEKETDLLIFPGGRDVPYHEALKGEKNRSIYRFVEEGGSYLGICAGAYYGSAEVEFDKGFPLEVLGKRELPFFKGKAIGPAYGKGTFCYTNEKGGRISSLTLENGSPSFSYFNGGSFFFEAEKTSDTAVLATYKDIFPDIFPAAIIQTSVGKGKVILSGVHPEYSGFHPKAATLFSSSQLLLLQEKEKERKALFESLLERLLA